jgi:hypothetical protein
MFSACNALFCLSLLNAFTALFCLRLLNGITALFCLSLVSACTYCTVWLEPVRFWRNLALWTQEGEKWKE